MRDLFWGPPGRAAVHKKKKCGDQDDPHPDWPFIGPKNLASSQTQGPKCVKQPVSWLC